MSTFSKLKNFYSIKPFTHKSFFTKERIRSTISALILLFLALVFQYYASAFSDRKMSNFVHDIFLDNTSAIDLTGAIIEGAFSIIVISVLLVLSRPKTLLFSIKAVSLFVAIRAAFIAMTHLGIYPSQIIPSDGFFESIYTDLGIGAGFFFSGHTGLPFLMSLIFWKDVFWRYSYLLISIIFAVSVLFAHMHYSIDVFAAPFITYTIFKISEYLFPEDHRLSQE